MKIKISELNPNPFKKFINDGKLDGERVGKLKESIEHGTLPENFTARKSNGKYEIASGHHRLEAIKQVKGMDYEVGVEEVNYDDETMLIDMVRENLTQRDTDFKDTEDSIVLARAWLQSGVNSVKRFNEIKHQKTQKNPKGAGRPDEPDSSRQIAQFLSKQGKMISHVTICSYLTIYDKLDPELHEKVQKLESATKEEREEALPKRVASELAQIEQEYQKPVYEQIKSAELNKENSIKAISTFKKAPEVIKKRVIEGKIGITDIENEMKVRDVGEKLGLSEQEKLDNIPIKMEEILDAFIDGFSKIDSRLWDKGFISEFLMPNVPIERAESLEKKMEHTIYETLIPFYEELKLQIELRKEK